MQRQIRHRLLEVCLGAQMLVIAPMALSTRGAGSLARSFKPMRVAARSRPHLAELGGGASAGRRAFKPLIPLRGGARRNSAHPLASTAGFWNVLAAPYPSCSAQQMVACVPASHPVLGIGRDPCRAATHQRKLCCWRGCAIKARGVAAEYPGARCSGTTQGKRSEKPRCWVFPESVGLFACSGGCVGARLTTHAYRAQVMRKEVRTPTPRAQASDGV